MVSFTRIILDLFGVYKSLEIHYEDKLVNLEVQGASTGVVAKSMRTMGTSHAKPVPRGLVLSPATLSNSRPHMNTFPDLPEECFPIQKSKLMNTTDRPLQPPQQEQQYRDMTMKVSNPANAQGSG